MSLPSSTIDKTALRKALLDRRQHLDEAGRARKDAAIASHLERYLSAHPLKTLGVFWPIRNEPDLVDFYRRLVAEHIQLALPVVTEKNAPLSFAAWSPGDRMTKDAFGVPVPEKQNFLKMPEALLVPCVGFNSSRYRIGYGGGFYDRTLALAPKPLAIGIAYSFQLVKFETSEHDVPLDLIVTEVSY
ncbi:MAG: 5-formyltetrahydrofolate cyclo-ligase [Oxalobacter sp.]|nr:MAG: 5-formyltetrahydrofolate cyclo-ligase [Oxalobacter sp.]